MNSYSASVSTVPGAAGTYAVGFCARNPSAATFTINKVFGWVMVTNEPGP